MRSDLDSVAANTRRWSRRATGWLWLLMVLTTVPTGCGGADRHHDPPAPETEAPGTGGATDAQQPGGEEPRLGSSWVRLRRPAQGQADHRPDGPSRQTAEALESIGYLSGSVLTADGLSGVTVYERDRTQPGLNLVVSAPRGDAILMDSGGGVIHRWSARIEDVFPGRPRERLHWRRARLLEDGGLLVIYAGAQGMVKLDRDSNVIWARFNRAHHAFDVAPNGEIYVLTRKARVIPRIDPEHLVLEDFVSVLDADGRVRRRVSLLEALERSSFKSGWEARQAQGLSGDIFHTNSVQVLVGRSGNRPAEFRAGNVLISILYLDMLAVLDMEQEQLVWAHRGTFKRQHDLRLLASGNLLVFDNLGLGEASRVLELDPGTGATVWEYRGSVERPFYSKTRGLAQRLENGNTLITETDNGRAFEITPAGETVWEYYTPDRAGPNDEYIAALLEVVRLPEDQPMEWAGPAVSGVVSARNEASESP